MRLNPTIVSSSLPNSRVATGGLRSMLPTVRAKKTHVSTEILRTPSPSNRLLAKSPNK